MRRDIYLNAARVTYSLSRTLLMSPQGCTYVILYELATRTLHARRHHPAYVGEGKSRPCTRQNTFNLPFIRFHYMFARAKIGAAELSRRISRGTDN